ncbi:MAG: GntR family transcriptional regulator, partial [Erysipelotrichaceae bacterium]|nr:GntR family transcriptional regulator [Erysipelotrichaceae bacterium]
VQKALSELEREGLMKSERTLGRFISIDDEKIKDIKKHLALETTYEYLNNIKEIGYSKDEILELIKEVTKDEQ